MIRHRINNYWKQDPITVFGLAIDNHKPMVMISQMAGSMTFQHALTPDQAREMAAALLVAVSDAETEAIKAATV